VRARDGLYKSSLNRSRRTSREAPENGDYAAKRLHFTRGKASISRAPESIQLTKVVISHAKGSISQAKDSIFEPKMPISQIKASISRSKMLTFWLKDSPYSLKVFAFRLKTSAYRLKDSAYHLKMLTFGVKVSVFLMEMLVKSGVDSFLSAKRGRDGLKSCVFRPGAG
jgi:hypothetical protein